MKGSVSFGMTEPAAKVQPRRQSTGRDREANRNEDSNDGKPV